MLVVCVILFFSLYVLLFLLTFSCFLSISLMHRYAFQVQDEFFMQKKLNGRNWIVRLFVCLFVFIHFSFFSFFLMCDKFIPHSLFLLLFFRFRFRFQNIQWYVSLTCCVSDTTINRKMADSSRLFCNRNKHLNICFFVFIFLLSLSLQCFYRFVLIKFIINGWFYLFVCVQLS